MRKVKSIKKWVITVAATSLLVTGFIPIGVSHAETLQPEQIDYFSSLFSKYGIDWEGYSQNSNNHFAKRNTATHHTATHPASSQAKPANTTQPQATEKEQSNGHRAIVADQIIKTGEKFLGTPYKFGSPSGYTKTFDCSSFVQYVYGVNGIKLPRSSRQQAQVGQTIPRSQIQKGDLLFFTTSHSNGQIGHVAIYAGNNRVLHTWGPGGVRYDSLDTAWLKYGYVTAKRVIPD
jgi:cell wall-associated NlpC family hydrolase